MTTDRQRSDERRAEKLRQVARQVRPGAQRAAHVKAPAPPPAAMSDPDTERLAAEARNLV